MRDKAGVWGYRLEEGGKGFKSLSFVHGKGVFKHDKIIHTF